MRIVAGTFRGRKIDAPESDRTRPTTDKVREAVFNALGSLSAVHDARIVDLFAGSGALGIEAISRGAAHCTFVESDRAALATIKKNIDHLGIAPLGTVVAGDVSARIDVVQDADIVLIDPPYDYNGWQKLLDSIASICVNSEVTVVAESGKALGNIEGWESIRNKRYGRTWVTFLQRIP